MRLLVLVTMLLGYATGSERSKPVPLLPELKFSPVCVDHESRAREDNLVEIIDRYDLVGMDEVVMMQELAQLHSKEVDAIVDKHITWQTPLSQEIGKKKREYMERTR